MRWTSCCQIWMPCSSENRIRGHSTLPDDPAISAHLHGDRRSSAWLYEHLCVRTVQHGNVWPHLWRFPSLAVIRGEWLRVRGKRAHSLPKKTSLDPQASAQRFQPTRLRSVAQPALSRSRLLFTLTADTTDEGRSAEEEKQNGPLCVPPRYAILQRPAGADQTTA